MNNERLASGDSGKGTKMSDSSAVMGSETLDIDLVSMSDKNFVVSDVWTVEDFKVWWEIAQNENGSYTTQEIESIAETVNLFAGDFYKNSDQNEVMECMNFIWTNVVLKLRNVIESEGEVLTFLNEHDLFVTDAQRYLHLKCDLGEAFYGSVAETIFNIQNAGRYLVQNPKASLPENFLIDYAKRYANSVDMDNILHHKNVTERTITELYKLYRGKHIKGWRSDFVLDIMNHTKCSPRILNSITAKAVPGSAEMITGLNSEKLTTATIIEITTKNENWWEYFTTAEKLALLRSPACPAHLKVDIIKNGEPIVKKIGEKLSPTTI